MKAKFTKGPWAMCHRGESLQGASGQDVVVWGCGLANGTKTAERDANSALIATAPEMYTELENLLCLEGIINTAKIKALLAKARGE
jgi:hypothetical protein